MKLKNKVLLGVGCVWLVFLAATYAGSYHFLAKSFLRLEQEHANSDLTRIDQALDQINYSLYTFTSDWSHWNDLYTYLQGKNPDFIKNNINMPAFVTSNINFLAYWDLNGKLLTTASADTDREKFTSSPQGLDKYLAPGSFLLNRKDVQSDLRGYVLLDNCIMMIAACAATDSDKKQPPLGIMVAGRILSPNLIQKMKDTTKLDVQLLLPQEIQTNGTLQNIYQTLSTESTSHFSKPISKNDLAGYTLIRDIFNQPIGMLEMVSPRAIYLTGLKAIHYYLTSFVTLGILFSILMLGLLHWLVIKRLERLDLEVAEIGTKKSLHQRVGLKGNDELTSVSSQINSLLDIIQTSHEQLEQRVLERTKELNINKEHLAKLAHYDPVTNLPNRVFFNEMLNKSIHQATREHKKLAVLFMDLDKFKNINDAFGHNMGDLVLKEIASRFAKTLRAGDIVARIGGDEFIILLNDISNTNSAVPVAEKLLKTCAEPIHIHSHEFHLSSSIGICIFPDNGTSLEDLQKNADMAMYKAKNAGGNIYEFFTPDMHSAASDYMKWEAAMRRALMNDEFMLYYQPKLNLAEKTITGVEALIRWNHPELGLISPAKFIPIAEESGLIMQMGEWALRAACRANQSWQEQGYKPITIAVNLSPIQFRHQDILTLVKSILTETKLDPKFLELEITESAVMDNNIDAAAKLTEIQNMGVSIAIDDFGTGYTSISYFKQFPINTIKIDQSFIKGITANTNDLAITSGIIALAHSLDIKVVAEGVETAEQLKLLKDHHCDLIQGYYLSRPLPQDKLLELLAQKELAF